MSDTNPPVLEGAFKDVTEVAVELSANHLRKALEYKIHGKYDDSIMEYSKAIELSGSSAIAYFNRGELFMMQNKRDEAIADFEKVVSLTESPELTQMAKKHIDELKK